MIYLTPVIKVIIEGKEIKLLDINEIKYDLIKPKTTWPAVIFAANRKDNVSGRTKVLSVSIITRNGFNQSGAPPGSRLAVAE